MKNQILDETIGYQEAKEVIKKRANTYWFQEFQHLYGALEQAIAIKNLNKTVRLEIESLPDGITNYLKIYHKFDYAYRKFVYHADHAEHIDILKDLVNLVENIYSNSFLLKLNDLWQKHIDTCTDWKIAGFTSQRDFFSKHVKPFIDDDKRIFVIISDGLRYEAGMELHRLLLQEDKYQSDLSPMISMLPSYTQMGMAALLPNKKLSYNKNNQNVFVDDIHSSSQNRAKILQEYVPESTTMQAEDFLSLNREKGREFTKEYKLIYIYHNGIDATGDNFKSESKVFDAVEKEFDLIKKIIKQIVNFNGTNILITADHGFIYQHRDLDESDFSTLNKDGKIYASNRRFLIGSGLFEDSCVKKFNGSQLNIDDDTDFLIAKSINRLRIQGPGSRYVHGGASLQEIVVPVIHFNKKRISDVRKVEVDIIKSYSKITSNQVAISFYQKEPIQDKVQPRELKIGFYSKDGRLLSDETKILFNSDNSDARARERKHRFIFKSEASDYNNQTLTLRLSELIEGTNQYRIYKEDTYTIYISFASEFDDF